MILITRRLTTPIKSGELVEGVPSVMRYNTSDEPLMSSMWRWWQVGIIVVPLIERLTECHPPHTIAQIIKSRGEGSDADHTRYDDA